MITALPKVVRYKHTECQASRSCGGFEVLTLGLTLGKGSGSNFKVSQSIPIQAVMLTMLSLPMSLGVFVPLTLGFHFTYFRVIGVHLP